MTRLPSQLLRPALGTLGLLALAVWMAGGALPARSGAAETAQAQATSRQDVPIQPDKSSEDVQSTKRSQDGDAQRRSEHGIRHGYRVTTDHAIRHGYAVDTDNRIRHGYRVTTDHAIRHGY
jgi:hypothetical protein